MGFLPLNKGLMAGIARRGGNRLIDRVTADLLPATSGRSGLGKKLLGAALVRVATRSVPGAIIVGGGLLARALHKKHKEEQAQRAIDVVARKPR